MPINIPANIMVQNPNETSKSSLLHFIVFTTKHTFLVYALYFPEIISGSAVTLWLFPIIGPCPFALKKWSSVTFTLDGWMFFVKM